MGEGGFCEAKDGGSSIKPLHSLISSASTYFTNPGISPKASLLRFGVERPQCGMQRNGERAGTGRIESGSEQGDHVPTRVARRSRGGGTALAVTEGVSGDAKPAFNSSSPPSSPKKPRHLAARGRRGRRERRFYTMLYFSLLFIRAIGIAVSTATIAAARNTE